MPFSRSYSYSLFFLLFSLSLSFSLSFYSFSRTRNIRIHTFTDEYMPMYVRVHIQSTSRMCFFYGDYNFVTVFLIGRKSNRGRAGQILMSSQYHHHHYHHHHHHMSFPRATDKTLIPTLIATKYHKKGNESNNNARKQRLLTCHYVHFKSSRY